MGSNDPIDPYAPPKALAESEPGPEAFVDVERPKPKWKTIVAHGEPARALEDLKLLERAKIECRVLADGTASSGVAFHWVRSNPLGGHLVQVRPDDLANAAKV